MKYGSAFADYIKIWDETTSGYNSLIKADQTGWNEYNRTVNFEYQVHYYVNYNWLDNVNRTIQVTAKMYEDDGWF